MMCDIGSHGLQKVSRLLFVICWLGGLTSLSFLICVDQAL